MPHREPTPEEQRRAWSTARIMTAVTVVVILFVLVVIIFRGCHDGAVEPHMIDPDQEPLPGVEDLSVPIVAASTPRPVT